MLSSGTHGDVLQASSNESLAFRLLGATFSFSLDAYGCQGPDSAPGSFSLCVCVCMCVLCLLFFWPAPFIVLQSLAEVTWHNMIRASGT